MKVILLRDVDRVGKSGEIVKVTAGYARNYLIPQRQALVATDSNVAQFETQRRQFEAVAEREQRSAEVLAATLEKASLTQQVKVGEGDRMFGSVTAQNIADLLKEQGHDIDRRKVHLEEPIRALGVYNVEIQVEAEVKATVKLWVVEE
ncbi:MAG: 50S ribosomal protein L9 [Candidatus Latescibacterota bacterium]|nr:50S ribosomal protein L9 [Candidatus Latescibacterota bacterium]